MMWETTTGHQRCATDYLEYMIELSNNSETPTTGILDNQITLNMTDHTKCRLHGIT